MAGTCSVKDTSCHHDIAKRRSAVDNLRAHFGVVQPPGAAIFGAAILGDRLRLRRLSFAVAGAAPNRALTRPRAFARNEERLPTPVQSLPRDPRMEPAKLAQESRSLAIISNTRCLLRFIDVP